MTFSVSSVLSVVNPLLNDSGATEIRIIPAMDLLTAVCSIPTAPFCEERVLAFIDEFPADRPGVRLSKDSLGNRLLQVGGRAKAPRLVFVAHTDHPGFVAGEMEDQHILRARFRGGVAAEYVKNAKVRFFFGPDETTGRVKFVAADERGRATDCEIKVKSFVPAGSPGMFDLHAGKIKGKKHPRFHGRCCDDLAGVASALAMLDELAADPPKHTVGVLLTRAEEDGFIGALGSVISPKLLRPTDRLVSIETSAAQPAAPLGGGVTIRVGDATSVFDSRLTHFLTAQAKSLAEEDESFRYQRALMPGGTCEATVFDCWGYEAAAACVPLGNYHNMDREKGKVAEEFIDVTDWRNMVKLFVRCARNADQIDAGFGELKQRLEKRFEEHKPLL